LGLLDPGPDPLVRGTDPDPSINVDSNCFNDLFMTFYI
jgi:hypothetical protein